MGGALGGWRQELKEDMDLISGRDPELNFGSGSQGADRLGLAVLTPLLLAQPTGRPPSQPLSMKMNPILKAAPKSWQDGNSDLTVSSGPPRQPAVPRSQTS